MERVDWTEVGVPGNGLNRSRSFHLDTKLEEKGMSVGLKAAGVTGGTRQTHKLNKSLKEIETSHLSIC